MACLQKFFATFWITDRIISFNSKNDPYHQNRLLTRLRFKEFFGKLGRNAAVAELICISLSFRICRSGETGKHAALKML